MRRADRLQGLRPARRDLGRRFGIHPFRRTRSLPDSPRNVGKVRALTRAAGGTMSHQRTKITPASIRAIKGLEQVGYLPRCGIYFLCKKDQVVYIGRSINVAARVAAYSKKWDDRIYFLTLSRVCLTLLDQALINALKPKYTTRTQSDR